MVVTGDAAWTDGAPRPAPSEDVLQAAEHLQQALTLLDRAKVDIAAAHVHTALETLASLFALPHL